MQLLLLNPSLPVLLNDDSDTCGKRQSLICSQDVDWNGFGRDEQPCEHFRKWRKKETSGIVESQIHNSINQKCPIRLPIAVLSFPANSDGNHVPAELEQGNLSRVHHIFWNGNQNRGTQSDLKPSCTNYSGFFKT